MKNINILYISICVLVFNFSITFSNDFKTLDEKVEYYKNLFNVECANQKITDNFGNGNDKFYGTRNMRPILHGIAYRGGANNFYHKDNKRDNHNPLPEDGLTNLCLNGFSNSVYLYATNFKSSKTDISKDGKTLKYIQKSGNSKEELNLLFTMILNAVNNPPMGPIYLHCWNGWHQSGYVSSAILMQFCGLSNEEAYQYWLDNTDGVNKGYDNVKSMVKNFKKLDNFSIPDSVKSLICPCIKKNK